MEYIFDSEKILDIIDHLSKGKLNFRDDLGRLIELSIKNDKMKILEDLSFQARYAQGLLKIIQNRDNNIDEEYFAKVQNEFTESIQKIKISIELLLSFSSNFIKEIFIEKYLQMSQVSFSNLNKLCLDLSYLKLYFNDMKREKR